MKKYRIIQVNKPDEIYYALQYRRYFWWSTVKDSFVDDFGICEFDMKFKTMDDAKEYHKKNRTSVIHVIVQEGF